MKIIDYGKKQKQPQLIGCLECEARMELEPGEELPSCCPVCGASQSSLYHVFEGGEEKKIYAPISGASKAFPELYDDFYYFGDISNNTEKVQKQIDDAIKLYYTSDSGYAYIEREGVLVFISQEDADDKDCYFVTITDTYKQLNSSELEQFI